MSQRIESSFRSLLENDNKTIIIPIIQRDYAQGRDDDKAKKVRSRLLNDWIAVLKDPGKRMDFNFIYGEETSSSVFFPVDGQQRITSLYLLHWFLAFKTNNADLIGKWNFDYKTRNSASEFFSFLKSETAVELFNILNNRGTGKYESIQDQKWFKTKWENDPTVVSCLAFLILLSDRIAECEAKEQNNDISRVFWDRLSDQNSPAIYFTYLPETNTAAEIHAARTYTRMNARGKKLTDFENLKAMIDELEFRQSAKFDISGSFDRIYIDYLYDKNLPLAEATKKINEYGLTWFKIVYYVYRCTFPDPVDSYEFFELADHYEDEIYNLSQGRTIDTNINEYLKMQKAILELVCNSSDSIDINNSGLLSEPSRETIAFVLYAYKKWASRSDNTEQQQKNQMIAREWTDFRLLLEDLKYENWDSAQVNDVMFAKIISNILKDYSDNAGYFTAHDFDTDNPFVDWNILPDLKCRVLECKIMWHMIRNNLISEDKIRAFNQKHNGRTGYFYYLCGYLRDNTAWKLGDLTFAQLPAEAKTAEKFIHILSDILSYLNSSTLNFDYRLKAVYAYTSQYDIQNGQLLPQAKINECTDAHIWNADRLIWNDAEYGQLSNEKTTQLNRLKNMLLLLSSYSPRDPDQHIKEYYDHLKNSLATGYEDCWLRFSFQYQEAGEVLLNHRLTLTGNSVNVIINEKPYDTAILTYLISNAYTEKENGILKELTTGDKWYYMGNNIPYEYSKYNSVCVFSENKRFEHSSDPNKSFETFRNKVNMDLTYNIFAKIKGLGGINYLSFERDAGNDIIIKIYEKGSAANGQIEINAKEIRIDAAEINTMDNKMTSWISKIDNIVAYPEQNQNSANAYDTWLDLRSGSNTSVSAAVPPKFSRGARKKWIWDEEYFIIAGAKPLPAVSL